MPLVEQIHAGGAGGLPRPTHQYLRGICSAYFMKEALEWAGQRGEIIGATVRDGMYARSDWVPVGLEGVCLPSTWTAEDHRGTTSVNINAGSWVGGEVQIEKIASVELPRRPEWLGY